MGQKPYLPSQHPKYGLSCHLIRRRLVCHLERMKPTSPHHRDLGMGQKRYLPSRHPRYRLSCDMIRRRLVCRLAKMKPNSRDQCDLGMGEKPYLPSRHPRYRLCHHVIPRRLVCRLARMRPTSQYRCVPSKHAESQASWLPCQLRKISYWEIVVDSAEISVIVRVQREVPTNKCGERFAR